MDVNEINFRCVITALAYSLHPGWTHLEVPMAWLKAGQGKCYPSPLQPRPAALGTESAHHANNPLEYRDVQLCLCPTYNHFTGPTLQNTWCCVSLQKEKLPPRMYAQESGPGLSVQLQQGRTLVLTRHNCLHMFNYTKTNTCSHFQIMIWTRSC